MTQEVRQDRKNIGEPGKSTTITGRRSCPRCGGEMTTTRQGVVASFPSPALERLVCSDSGCNYAKYVKLDSNGFFSDGSPAARKGAQGA
ncbi:MAG: hypothetical protein V5A87_02435 [Candidatus Bipolaricaulota bacterium]|nr:hypothetical protein [Candidatus Bipolaricaulota bacterium]MBS3791384.1 hypothetical protein [Candidatus Bipolaricaulota bacterium]